MPTAASSHLAVGSCSLGRGARLDSTRGQTNADGGKQQPCSAGLTRAACLPFAKFNLQAIWISYFGTFGRAERDWAERYRDTFVS